MDREQTTAGNPEPEELIARLRARVRERREDSGEAQGRVLRDRAFPLWARAIAGAFALAHAATHVALVVLALGVVDLAIGGGSAPALWPLAAAAGVGLALALLFDLAGFEALAGYEAPVDAMGARVSAAVAVALGGVLAIVHPLLAAGIATSLAILLADRALLSRFRRLAPGWRLTAPEARSVLAGRDHVGARLAARAVDAPGGVIRRWAVLAGAAVGTLGGAWLALREITTPAGAVAASLASIWAGLALARWHAAVGDPAGELRMLGRDLARIRRSPRATGEAEGEPPGAGLDVRELSVTDSRTGARLLSEISLTAPHGEIIALVGEPGVGMSLLLRALIDPLALRNAEVTGSVHLDDEELWERSARGRPVPAVLVPPSALLLPGSAIDNLLCFSVEPERAEKEARRALEALQVYGITAERLLSRADARDLSETERQILSLARAVWLRPRLLLLDQPELSLPFRILGALARRLKEEARAGRIIVMATEARPLLEICDRVLVMESGKIIDSGPREEVLARRRSGVSRLLLDPDPDAEDRLHNWLKAQFNRPGDDGNRRQLCLVGSDLLALAAWAPPRLLSDGGSAGEAAAIKFEFRHEQGWCELSLSDYGEPIG
ncbi:MAG: ATP-binding cassette domain-containing protein, partial [Alphaproteobacteria bacterium]